MLTTRRAGTEDARVIGEQRRRMFAESGQASAGEMGRMVENFEAWVRPRLEEGTYLGWMMEEDGVVVAGAGVWLMAFPPHWMDPEPVRAYLLNFYTEPSHRGRGLAGELLRTTLAEVRGLGIKVTTLHASKFGRPIYERNGFVATNEMMLREEG